jgi:hypothetical protein
MTQNIADIPVTEKTMNVDLTKQELEIILQLMLQALPPQLQQLLQKITIATQEISRLPKEE